MNEKLTAERNRPIGRGVAAALFVDGAVIAPDFMRIKISLPSLGLEYYQATSITTHHLPSGDVTAQWNLPVIGVVVAPRIYPMRNAPWLVARPISGGVYFLGTPLDAGLTVSDRRGRLDAASRAVGVSTRIGIETGTERFRVAGFAAYRFLRFSSVSITPHDSFTDVPGGRVLSPFALPEVLDFSGPMVSMSLSVRLPGK
jgi:hypothetical protein